MDWQVRVVGARNLQITRRRRITYRHLESSPHLRAAASLAGENTYVSARDTIQTKRIGNNGKIRSDQELRYKTTRAMSDVRMEKKRKTVNGQ